MRFIGRAIITTDHFNRSKKPAKTPHKEQFIKNEKSFMKGGVDYSVR